MVEALDFGGDKMSDRMTDNFSDSIRVEMADPHFSDSPDHIQRRPGTNNSSNKGLSPRSPAKLQKWNSAFGNEMSIVEDEEETIIKFGFEPDFLRSVFWGLFLALLAVGGILTETLGEYDPNDNPIMNTFGANNPCLWLDYPPSTYITPSIWVITSNIYLMYCLFRWYRTTVAYRDKNFHAVGKWEYRLYTASMWVEAATVVFFSTVFSIGPDDDMALHTLPYTIVSFGVCLNVLSDFWYLTRVAQRRDWFWRFMLCYTVLICIFTFFKIHTELVVVGGPKDPYPWGIQGPWMFTVIPCNLIISIISGKHTKDMQITIAIPTDAHEWSQLDQSAEHGFFGGLVNEPAFCWILLTFVLVAQYLIYTGDLDCEAITVVGMWGVVRGIVYVGTILMILAGIVIYWSSNLCCLSSNFKNDLKLWHKVELRDDVNPGNKYTKSTIARAKRPVHSNMDEWWDDRMKETESYLIKPLLFILLLKHLFLTYSRLGSDKNSANGNGMIGLCTFGQISFFLYFCNYLWQIKYEDRGDAVNWPKAKLNYGQMFILWCVFVGFIRCIAGWTGEFEENYFGREC